jgi:hypothetical protein
VVGFGLLKILLVKNMKDHDKLLKFLFCCGFGACVGQYMLVTWWERKYKEYRKCFEKTSVPIPENAISPSPSKPPS